MPHTKLPWIQILWQDEFGDDHCSIRSQDESVTIAELACSGQAEREEFNEMIENSALILKAASLVYSHAALVAACEAARLYMSDTDERAEQERRAYEATGGEVTAVEAIVAQINAALAQAQEAK